MARLNLDPFPADLHRSIKTTAYLTGWSLRDWVIEACREKLRNDANPKSDQERLDEILGEEE